MVTRLDHRERFVGGDEHADERAFSRAVPRIGFETARAKPLDGASVGTQLTIPGDPLRVKGARSPIALEWTDGRALVKVANCASGRSLAAAADVQREGELPSGVDLRRVVHGARVGKR